MTTGQRLQISLLFDVNINAAASVHHWCGVDSIASSDWAICEYSHQKTGASHFPPDTPGVKPMALYHHALVNIPLAVTDHKNPGKSAVLYLDILPV